MPSKISGTHLTSLTAFQKPRICLLEREWNGLHWQNRGRVRPLRNDGGMDGEGCWDQIHSVSCPWLQWEGLQDRAVPWVHQMKTFPGEENDYPLRTWYTDDALEIIRKWRCSKFSDALKEFSYSAYRQRGRSRREFHFIKDQSLHRKSLECKTKSEVLEGELWALPTKPTSGSFSLSCGGQWWSLFPAGLKLW